MKAAVEIPPPSEGEITRKNSAFMGPQWGKGFSFFSLANISENHMIHWIHIRDTLRFSSIHFFPPHLISSHISVNEFIRFQVIFRNMRVIPPSQEILVKGEVKTTDIWVVLKHVSWHPLNIQTGLVVLQPDEVAKDRHLQKGRIEVELESDISLGTLKKLQEINALSDLFSKKSLE